MMNKLISGSRLALAKHELKILNNGKQHDICQAEIELVEANFFFLKVSEKFV